MDHDSNIKNLEKKDYPKLEPIISPWISNILSQKNKLEKYVNKFGSPINIHNPKYLTRNIRLFEKVLLKHGVKHRIFFARKPNKCISYVRQAKSLKIGVDTASANELRQCLEVGYNPSKIVLTAAIKNEKLLDLVVKKRILVMVDNYDELEMLNKIAKKHNTIHKFGIRVGSFSYKGRKLYSRFGFAIDRLEEVFERVKENKYRNIKFLGFHFHLDGYSIEQRAEAINQIIKVIIKLKERGIKTFFIDIGGGFTVKYLKSAKQWNDFKSKLKMAVMNKFPPITFKNNGLGYLKHKNKLLGKEEFYPYYNTLNKEKFLDKILSYKLSKKETLSGLFKKMDLELRIEPGRSSFDQCGITIARIAFRKVDQNNDWLIGLEMNMTQLLSSSADFLLDPKIVYLGKKYENNGIFCYFVGNYCLERDVILKRKIFLPKLPQVGDLVCFVNTAGYMMHFLESQSHQFGFAKNLVIKDRQKQLVLKPDA
ncbi:MAG: alanine racemase [Patescibacteria group bacterium]